MGEEDYRGFNDQHIVDLISESRESLARRVKTLASHLRRQPGSRERARQEYLARGAETEKPEEKEQERTEEEKPPIMITSFTSLKTGKVIKTIPPLDRETAMLFKTDVPLVLAMGAKYHLSNSRNRAYHNQEYGPIAVREFDLT